MNRERAHAAAAAGLLASPAAAVQPAVLAAWSQVFGATVTAGGPMPPTLELRSVLEAGGDCGGFAIEHRFEVEGG